MKMSTLRAHTVQSSHSMKSPAQNQFASIARRSGSRESPDERTTKTIHSGQFMTSRLHDKSAGDYLSEDEDDVLPIYIDKVEAGYNFDDARKDTYTTYSFGPKSTQTLAIDASLSRLFEHMTLAYSGKITSPKWKPFRGMHLRVKDKIRLNNIIWREWHMQYVFGKNPLVCHFATPLHDDVHTKPEAIVLEGYYWKRRLDTITNEYKTFRKFFQRQRTKQLSFDDIFGDSSNSALLEKVGEIHSTSDFPKHQQTSHTDLVLNSRDLQDMMDLSDSLFSNLNQPFAFPNPRELSGFGYGDFIQPGLVQLQPNLDDFMDLDPLTDMLSSVKSQSTGNLPESSQSGIHLKHGDVEMASSPQISHMSLGGHSSRMMVDSPSLTPSAGLSEHDPMIVDTENFILNQLQLLQQQKQEERGRQQQQQQRIQQQKLALEIQQKKQQEEQERLKEQQKREQLLAVQKQQQLQQQQQQQQKGQQLSALLQNPQLKTILNAMGENAPALLEELTKSLQAQQAQNQQTQQSANATQTLAQQQGAGKSDPQTSNLIQTHPQLKRQNSGNASTNTLSNLLSSPLSPPQKSSIQQLVNNSASMKQQTSNSGKYGGNTSILAALNADEKQTALNKLTIQPQGKTQTKTVFSANLPKKDAGGFTIPTVPFRVKGKPRHIAPAPPVSSTPQSSLSQQNSYLAQLLTTEGRSKLLTGTYPGALVNVKDESSGLTSLPLIQPAPASPQSTVAQSSPAVAAVSLQTGTSVLSSAAANGLTSLPLIQPAPASPQSTIAQSSPAVTAVSLQPMTPDFPTSVLLAAANHAFSSNSLTVKEVLQNVTLQASPNTSVLLASSSPHKQDNLMSPAPSPSSTPIFSPQSMSSPASITSPASSSMEEYQYTLKSPEPCFTDMHVTERHEEDIKKTIHLSSEKKRRYNIKTAGQMQKSGFDVLHSLIPSLSSNPNAKVSKAAMLQKTAEYCRKLKAERKQMQNEADILKQEIASLNQAISVCQQQLPATGVPVTRQRADQMKEMFEEYVKQRTLTNWKFWIFSLIIRNLFDSYNTMVSTASVDELCRSALAWLDQHCSLPSLRPIGANAMRHLSTTTSILSDPARVPEQAAQAVIKRQSSTSEENNT